MEAPSADKIDQAELARAVELIQLLAKIDARRKAKTSGRPS